MHARTQLLISQKEKEKLIQHSNYKFDSHSQEKTN